MHSVSPYSIRFFNKDLAGPIADRYDVLEKIGAFDAYIVLRDFIAVKNNGAYTVKPMTQQIFRFKSFDFDDRTRRIRGVFQSGKYGYEASMVNVRTGKLDYTRVVENAEVKDYYIDMLLPAGVNEGICLMLNHNGDGVKTLVHEVIKDHFNNVAARNLRMNPLSYVKAYHKWLDAQAKEIRLVKFNKCDDVADRLARLGHGEQTLLINSGRKKSLGTLKDYLAPGTDEHALLEVLTPLCSQVRTKVALKGKTRTFRFGRDLDDQVCQIEIDETDVPNVNGNPDIPSLIVWSSNVLKEIVANLYPGVKIPL